VSTHRIVVTLTRAFDDSYGGHLVLFDRLNPEDSAVVVAPTHNTGIALQFSDHSWHYIDDVVKGERYSLIYSFWTAESSLHSVATAPLRLPRDEYGWLVNKLRELGADRFAHTKRPLLDHLAGTCELLMRWECDAEVCMAGLFHSVLGAKNVPGALVAPEDESLVRNLIGDYALELVKLFGRFDFKQLVGMLQGTKLVDPMPDRQTLVDLVTIAWANSLEQLTHATVLREHDQAWIKGLFEDTERFLPAQTRAAIAGLVSGDDGAVD
jgi:hypothetical protein